MLLRAEGNACKVGQQRVLNLLHNMYLVGIFVHSPRGAFTRFHTARNAVQDLLDNYNRRLWRAC